MVIWAISSLIKKIFAILKEVGFSVNGVHLEFRCDGISIRIVGLYLFELYANPAG